MPKQPARGDRARDFAQQLAGFSDTTLTAPSGAAVVLRKLAQDQETALRMLHMVALKVAMIEAK
ncbi:hypothetical protein [Devosia sp. A449]